MGLAHIDKATVDLMDNLCRKNMAVRQAVIKTMAEIGPDPDWDAQLKYYPAECSTKTIRKLIRQG